MYFEKAIEYLKEGKSIRRKCWNPIEQVTLRDRNIGFTSADIKATDWEVCGFRFYEAVNKLLTQKGAIYHIGDTIENKIYYRDREVYKGLGTSEARKYKFTEKDQLSNDWAFCE